MQSLLLLVKRCFALAAAMKVLVSQQNASSKPPRSYSSRTLRPAEPVAPPPGAGSDGARAAAAPSRNPSRGALPRDPPSSDGDAALFALLSPPKLARVLAPAKSSRDGAPRDAAWLAAYWSAVASRLSIMAPDDIAVLCFSAARSRACPPNRVAAAVATFTLSSLPKSTPCDIAHLLTGFASWAGAGVPPPPRSWCDAAFASLLAASPSPKELQLCLSAAARMRLRLPLASLEAVEAAASSLALASFTPGELCATLWALTKLFGASSRGAAPSASFLDGAAAEIRRKAPLLSSSDLSVALHAFADARHRPSDAWVATVCSASVQQLPFAPPQALAVSLWAFAVLDARPPQPWLDAWDGRAAEVLAAPACASPAAGVSGRPASVPRGSSAPCFTRQACSMVCWAAASLQLYHALPCLPAAWGALTAGLADDVAASSPAPASASASSSAPVSIASHGASPPPPSPIDLRAVHEVWSLSRVEAPGRLARPPHALLSASAAAWAAQHADEARPAASATHRAVEAALRRELRLDVEASHVCKACGRRVDAALAPQGTLRIAIQARDLFMNRLTQIIFYLLRSCNHTRVRWTGPAHSRATRGRRWARRGCATGRSRRPGGACCRCPTTRSTSCATRASAPLLWRSDWRR